MGEWSRLLNDEWWKFICVDTIDEWFKLSIRFIEDDMIYWRWYDLLKMIRFIGDEWFKLSTKFIVDD